MVDIDREGLQQAVESMPRNCAAKAEVTSDTTEALPRGCWTRDSKIIPDLCRRRGHESPVIALFNGQGLDMTPDPSRVQAWNSYIVSSASSSQLNISGKRVGGVPGKFGHDSPRIFFFQRARPIYATNGFAGTASSWPRLLSEDGRIIVADTVAETPYLSEFRRGPLNAMVNSVVSFLTTLISKTFCRTQENRHWRKVRRAAAIRLAGDAAGRRRQGDELLQSFNDRLSAENKRVMAWRS